MYIYMYINLYIFFPCLWGVEGRVCGSIASDLRTALSGRPGESRPDGIQVPILCLWESVRSDQSQSFRPSGLCVSRTCALIGPVPRFVGQERLKTAGALSTQSEKWYTVHITCTARYIRKVFFKKEKKRTEKSQHTASSLLPCALLHVFFPVYIRY